MIPETSVIRIKGSNSGCVVDICKRLSTLLWYVDPLLANDSETARQRPLLGNGR
jgi:hypothetical protein